MSTASFLTFATLLVLMTLSWSQPGEAAPTSDDGNPERAAAFYENSHWKRVKNLGIGNQRKCADGNQSCSSRLGTLPCCSGAHVCAPTYELKRNFLGRLQRKQKMKCVWKPQPRPGSPWPRPRYGGNGRAQQVV